jgi:hypothetical protein
VLGPGPPPGHCIKFIDFSRFLAFLGLQYSRKNRHQSRHLRPTPPRKEPKSGNFSKKWVFIDFIAIFINYRLIGSGNSSRPNLLTIPFFKNIILYQIEKSKNYSPNLLIIDDEQLTEYNLNDNSKKRKVIYQEMLKTLNQIKANEKKPNMICSFFNVATLFYVWIVEANTPKQKKQKTNREASTRQTRKNYRQSNISHNSKGRKVESHKC